jgi:PEP-CTERM motif
MKRMKLTLRTVLCAVAFVALATTVNASTFSGSGWLVSNAASGNATPSAIAALGTPDFTFTATAVDFSSFGNLSNTGNGALDYTVNDFLNSLGSVTSITENTVGIGSTSLDSGGGGFLFQITGMAAVTNGQTFTVAHDDGLTLTIDGTTVVNAPGPTPPITTVGTYTGPTGNFAFEVDYGECCGAPAVLETDITGPPPAVPEPGSLLLVGIGILGVGSVRKFLS